MIIHLSFGQRFYLFYLRLKKIFPPPTPSSLSDRMTKIHLLVLERQYYCYLYSSVHGSNEISAKFQFAEVEKPDT